MAPALTAAAVEELKLCAEGGGPIGSFPLTGLKVTVTGGKSHPENSDETAFRIAAVDAFEKGVQVGCPVLLEPIMKVEVVSPEEFLGGVIGDLNSRRGQVQGTDSRGNAQIVTAMVPLANMFGYINTLRSMSQGRAQYTMQFDHYEQVPQNIAEEITKKFT